MILRRMTNAVKRQDWFQVTIEILIVVIGIFLGLQVTEWNEGRELRAEEGEYLNRLHRDFSKSILQNEENNAYLANQNSRSQFVLERLNACQLADQDKDRFATALFNTGKYRPPFLSRGVIDELQSTGKFQIIENVDLRMAISEHIDLIANYDETDNAISNQIQPHVTYLEKFLTYNIESNNFGAGEITWQELPVEIDQLCKVDGFARTISLIKAYLIGNLNRSRQVVEEQRAIIKMIEAEMTK